MITHLGYSQSTETSDVFSKLKSDQFHPKGIKCVFNCMYVYDMQSISSNIMDEESILLSNCLLRLRIAKL